VFPAGALVRAFETFDAVGAGVADMYHSAEYYWEKKSPAFNFFAAVPFGFTANELFAWVQYGGGQALWDALSGQFNVKPFLCCNTGTQMGGWFTREVSSPEAFRGLPHARARWRGPPAAGCHRRERAWRRNRTDAQIRRYRQGMGRALARHGPRSLASYYYYPGFQEPSAGQTIGINKRVWESFGTSERQIIEDAAEAEYTRALAEFNANNALSLRQLRDEGTVKILKFSDAVLKELYRISRT